MALRGSIEDVPIVDVLQFVHLSGKSGALTVSSSRGPAWVEFSQGDIVFARGPVTRTLGELLVEKGLLSRESLATAVLQQERTPERVPIGQVLVSQGLIARDALVDAVKQQIHDAMMDIVGLRSGEFQFEQTPIEAPDDIRLDAADVLPALRLNTQFMLLEAMRLFDEQNRPPESGAEARSTPPAATDRGSPVAGMRPAPTLVSNELEAGVFQRPRVIAEPTLPPNRSAPVSQAMPTPGPVRSTHGGILLVGFEKTLLPIVSEALTRAGYRISAHVPTKEVAQQFLKEKRWPSSMILLWRVRADAAEPQHVAQQTERLQLLDALKKPYPNWAVVALVSGWDSEAVGQLYARGLRAAIPFDPSALQATLATPGSPPGFLGGLLSVVGQLWRENARAAEAQAAELRAWLQAKSVTSEMQRAIQRAAIALELMRIAAGTFERAALFLAKEDELIGLGAFGFTMSGQPMAEAFRGLALRAAPDSLLDRSFRDRVAIAGPTRELGLGRFFFDIAGHPAFDRGALIPVVGTARAIGVLYGDNGTLNAPLRSLHAIEMAAAQAGLAYENALLRLRLDAHREPSELRSAVG